MRIICYWILIDCVSLCTGFARLFLEVTNKQIDFFKYSFIFGVRKTDLLCVSLFLTRSSWFFFL